LHNLKIYNCVIKKTYTFHKQCAGMSVIYVPNNICAPSYIVLLFWTTKPKAKKIFAQSSCCLCSTSQNTHNKKSYKFY